jgi:hypothetical protein
MMMYRQIVSGFLYGSLVQSRSVDNHIRQPLHPRASKGTHGALRDFAVLVELDGWECCTLYDKHELHKWIVATHKTQAITVSSKPLLRSKCYILEDETLLYLHSFSANVLLEEVDGYPTLWCTPFPVQ